MPFTEQMPIECWLTVFDFVAPTEEYPLATVCGEWCSIFLHKREQRGEEKWSTLYDAVVTSPSRLEWARDAGLKIGEEVSAALGRCGQLEVFDWLKANRYTIDSNCVNAAAHHGHLSLLKCIGEEAVSKVDTAPIYAVCGCELEILKWLRYIGCPMNAHTWETACIVGHLDTLKWMKEAEVIRWSTEVQYNLLFYSMRNGHEDVLMWAQSVGCDQELWDVATEAAEMIAHSDFPLICIDFFRDGEE
jgi:hypothetical protein